MLKPEVRLEIEKLLKSTKRKGVKNLINALESLGYYNAPASTQFHLNEVGGLAEHSLNVCKTALEMNKILIKQGIEIPKDQIIIASLLHDLGKGKYYELEEYIPNVLKNQTVSPKKPWKINKGRPPIPHAIASLHIASEYIKLTPEESTAILYHDSIYVYSGMDIKNKEQPLQTLIHHADFWNARFIETLDCGDLS